jgi:hypothetical protein
VARENVMRGPYTLAQLQNELSMKRVLEGDYCWKQGFHEWRPLCTLDEIGLPQGPRLLTPYPTVDIPDGSSGARHFSSNSQSASNTSSGSTDRFTNVRLRLKKNSRSSMGIVQWAFCICFALALAYITTWVALTEVNREFQRKIQVATAGRLQSFGEMRFDETPLVAAFAEPVLSAPGFALEGVRVPVNVEGERLLGSETAWRSYSYGIQWGLKWSAMEEVAADEGVRPELDPIYVDKFQFKGYLSSENPRKILIRVAGEPGL